MTYHIPHPHPWQFARVGFVFVTRFQSCRRQTSAVHAQGLCLTFSHDWISRRIIAKMGVYFRSMSRKVCGCDCPYRYLLSTVSLHFEYPSVSILNTASNHYQPAGRSGTSAMRPRFRHPLGFEKACVRGLLGCGSWKTMERCDPVLDVVCDERKPTLVGYER